MQVSFRETISSEWRSSPISFSAAVLSFAAFGINFFVPPVASLNSPALPILATVLTILAISFSLTFFYTIFVKKMDLAGWMGLQCVLGVPAIFAVTLMPGFKETLSGDQLNWLTLIIAQMATALIYAVAVFRGAKVQDPDKIFYWGAAFLLSMPAYQKVLLVLGFGMQASGIEPTL